MRTKKSQLTASFIGNILEWYDFAIFGYLAVTIGKLFFPSDDPIISLLQSFSVFAIGYLARTLGGILFGQIGDKYGRSKALRVSIYLMAASTVSMGLLPTYEQLGIAATLLLILLRILQGISVGGEYVGTNIYIFESCPKKRQTFWCSFVTGSATVGVILGSLTIALLHYTFTQIEIENGAWRIPYLCGIVLAVFGIIARRYLLETEEFKKDVATHVPPAYPLLAAFKHSHKAILQIIALNVFISISFYTLFVWMPTFLHVFLGVSPQKALFLNTGLMIFLITLMPFCGLLADHIGRKKVALFSAVLITLLAYPLFQLIVMGSWWAILLALILLTASFSLMNGVTAAITASLFPVGHRYSAIGLSYNFSTSVFGATSPVVCTYLISKLGLISAPGIYMTVAGIVGIVTALSLKSRAGAQIH